MPAPPRFGMNSIAREAVLQHGASELGTGPSLVAAAKRAAGHTASRPWRNIISELRFTATSGQGPEPRISGPIRDFA
jgi:hypothetical protein